MRREPKGIVVNLVAVGTDEQRFCRKLSADVNQSSMHLAQVFATGRQVYPSHIAVLGEPDMMFRCVFRIRNSAGELTADNIDDVMRRLSSYHIVETYLIDDDGLQIGQVDALLEIGA